MWSGVNKNMRYTKFIIGGGIAGLTLAFYLDEYKVITTDLLGQLNSPIQLGPRIIQFDEYSFKFLTDVCQKYKLNADIIVKTAKIGYYEDSKVVDSVSDNFKQEYSMMTRGKREYESSFLSDGKNYISYLELDCYGSDTFIKVFELIANKIKKRIIKQEVIAIHPHMNKIILKSFNNVKYTDVISTIPLSLLTKLLFIPTDYNFELLPKTFCLCKIENEVDKELSNLYSYIYTVKNIWSRKTYLGDNVLYELVGDPVCKKIQGNSIINLKENVKIQIKSSLKVDEISGIKLSGRYGRWDHSIKLNDVIKQAMELTNAI